MSNNNWKIVTGDDGKQYYEISCNVNIGPGWQALNQKNPNQDGAAFVAIRQPESIMPPGPPYTLESILAMRNQAWDDRRYGYDDLRSALEWPEPYLPSITVNTWLPGDPDPAERRPSTGRFGNLDWEEEAS